MSWFGFWEGEKLLRRFSIRVHQHTHTRAHWRENKVKTTDKWQAYQYWWSLQYRVRSSREEQRRWRCRIERGLNERKIPTDTHKERESFFSSVLLPSLLLLWGALLFLNAARLVMVVHLLCLLLLCARVRKCCLVYFWQFETFSKNFVNWGNFAIYKKVKLLSLFSLFARGQIRLTTLNIK